MAAAQDMNVGLPGRAFKNPGKEILLFRQRTVTDGASPGTGIFAAKAEHAALDMHHPVMAVKGGEGHRLNQLEVFQPGGTDRAALGFPGPAFPGFPKLQAGFYQRPPILSPEKQGISKPEKGKSGKHKGEKGQHGSRYYSCKV
jgi:hypothetical protein